MSEQEFSQFYFKANSAWHILVKKSVKSIMKWLIIEFLVWDADLSLFLIRVCDLGQVPYVCVSSLTNEKKSGNHLLEMLLSRWDNVYVKAIKIVPVS